MAKETKHDIKSEIKTKQDEKIKPESKQKQNENKNINHASHAITPTKQTSITIEEMAVFCRKKGFVFPSSDIYGGLSGFWDFGPLGSELFNNIKQDFWKFFVQNRENMVGIEASIISHPRTWIASGHVENFGDIVLTCSKCKNKLRADHFIQEKLNINVEGKEVSELNKMIKDNNLKCPKCNSQFEEMKKFNLLFETRVGASEDKSSVAYLRGETAQGMFLNFKNIVDTSRVKLPFGIVQVGRCFRNEIAPRDFLFRSREFNIGEFEFFIHPKLDKCDLLTKEQLSLKIPLLSSETQEKGSDELKFTTIGDMLKQKKLEEWHAYWLCEQVNWFLSLGLNINNLKIREHTKTELSHYSKATFDIDYLYPFGSKEVAGNANRGQFDLNQHIKESGKDLSIFDEESKEKVIPKVIEPTFGMERAFLAVLTESYEFDEKRGNIVLHIAPKLAPVKVGVFPLINKLEGKSKEIFRLLQTEFVCQFDRSGSIGRRYARADEIGIPYCITVDFDTLEKNTVTLRDRETTKQIRVEVNKLKDVLSKLLSGENFGSFGEYIN